MGALPSEYEFEESQTKIAKKAVEKQEQKEKQKQTAQTGQTGQAGTEEKPKRKPKALQRKLVLTEALEAGAEDLSTIVKPPSALVTEAKKTTTRKKKAVEFVIEE